MKKLSVAFISFLLLAAIYSPAMAAGVPIGQKGKISQKKQKVYQQHEISNVYEYKEVYKSEEMIAVYVEGKSPVEIAADPKSGFHVEASITEDAHGKTIATAEGAYNEEKRAWLVTFVAPSDYTNTYKLHLYFFCSTQGAPCDDIYGRYARSIKSLPLTIR